MVEDRGVGFFVVQWWKRKKKEEEKNLPNLRVKKIGAIVMTKILILSTRPGGGGEIHLLLIHDAHIAES